MSPHQIKRLFPNASASVLAANVGDYGSGVPDQTPDMARPAPTSPASASGDQGAMDGGSKAVQPEQIQPSNENHAHLTGWPG